MDTYLGEAPLSFHFASLQNRGQCLLKNFLIAMANCIQFCDIFFFFFFFMGSSSPTPIPFFFFSSPFFFFFFVFIYLFFFLTNLQNRKFSKFQNNSIYSMRVPETKTN